MFSRVPPPRKSPYPQPPVHVVLYNPGCSGVEWHFSGMRVNTNQVVQERASLSDPREGWGVWWARLPHSVGPEGGIFGAS